MATEPESWAITARLILYHSQSTSARTLFLRHATGSVIAPEPLPFLSRVLDETGQDTGPFRGFLHTSSVALDYCTKRGLTASLLQ
ncbi:MAG: hypothetical protein LUO80_10515, partial [Methylococcaceae bacterium]|nr:hypothetical protein [Methylococcaceae bacterium]